MDRRAFLGRTALAAGELAAVGVWDLVANRAGAQSTSTQGGPPSTVLRPQGRTGASPYGELRAPDANGLRLPTGFTSRVIAVGGEIVPGTKYQWHPYSDGAACIPDGDGGWFYTSNSEVPFVGAGGVSSIHFDASGKIIDARRVCSDTTMNCSGGASPWGTWLSCEEIERGYVWECDPRGARDAKKLPALGVFTHEAVCFDPKNQLVYLTEDLPDGLFYRFVPAAWPDLAQGRLQAMRLDPNRQTFSWIDVPDPTAALTPIRAQLPNATRFNGGEGLAIIGSKLFMTSKGDNRVHAFDVELGTYVLVWDGAEPLIGVDQMVPDPILGQLFVAEDAGNMEVVLITSTGEVAPFARFEKHDDSEVSGLAFSPDLSRLYVSSQRGPTKKRIADLVPGATDPTPVGSVYEITGPFRDVTNRARVVERGGSGGDGSAATKLPYVAAAVVGGAALAGGALVSFRNRTGA